MVNQISEGKNIKKWTGLKKLMTFSECVLQSKNAPNFIVEFEGDNIFLCFRIKMSSTATVTFELKARVKTPCLSSC